MYTPYFELPSFSQKEQIKFRERWNSPPLSDVKDKIWQIIKEGGSKHRIHKLLSEYTQDGIEAENDLRGFEFWLDNQTIYTDNPHSLRFIDVSFSQFWNGTLHNWTVYSVGLAFTRFINMKFENCWFDGAIFYGAVLENVKFINCDFVSQNEFARCLFKNVQFQNCFFSESTFSYCKFDEQTSFRNIKNTCSKNDEIKIPEKEFASLIKGIKEGYQNGDCSSLAREYYFQQMQALRQFNSKDIKEKFYRWLFESLTGYGVKPWNTLKWIFRLFIVFSLLYIAGLATNKNPNPFWDGLILSAGSFFTFGAKTSLLEILPEFFKFFYVLEAAFGITLLATFITVLANYWFNWEK